MRNASAAASVERRATADPEGNWKCVVIGCGKPVQRSARNGLSEVWCKRCLEKRRRHGSASRRSYSGRELSPYRKAAAAWLKLHRDDLQVARVVRALDGLLAASGKPVEALAVRWLRPKDKARNALARLHAAGIGGDRLLLAALTVRATQARLGPRANREFTFVQIAKLLHRISSGTHIRTAWGVTLSRWPRSEGVFLRIMGETILDKAEIVATGEAIEEVLAIAEGKDDQRGL